MCVCGTHLERPYCGHNEVTQGFPVHRTHARMGMGGGLIWAHPGIMVYQQVEELLAQLQVRHSSSGPRKSEVCEDCGGGRFTLTWK